MTVTYTWSGLGYQDCASLYVGGVYYRLYTYVNIDNESIEGALYIEQDNGQDILVDRQVIYQGTNIEDDRFRPRCCATTSQFVVVWVLDGLLYKTRIDPATNTWSFIGTSSMGVGATSDLFDLHTLNSGDSHVVVYVNAANTLNIRRYDDYSWTQAWGATLAEEPINCLGCYGDATDDLIFAAYQYTDNSTGSARQKLRITHYNATTGAPQGTVDVFGTAYLADVDWSRVGICKVSSSFIAVAAEGIPDDPSSNFSDRFVAFRSLVQNGLAYNGNEHYCWNVNLQSRPWGYASETGAANDIYAVLGYKDTFTAGHSKWAQHFAYVCNLDYRNWGEDDHTVRPYSVCNLTLNTIDSRPAYLTNTVDFHSYNHLPHVSEPVNIGPNTKTRTIPLIEFGRTGIRAAPDVSTTRSEVIPVNATVTGFKFHHEDMWTYYRHGVPPNPPNNAENYLGPYPYSQFRNLEIGDSMFIGGGCPAIYDGRQIVEMGFLWAPELQFGTISDVGASAGVPDGNYLWTAVYEWRDSAGQLHRSAPAEPLYRSLTGGGPNSNVEIRARTMTLSLKEGFRYPDASSIEIVLYRTANDRTVFYRVYGGDGTSGWGSGTIENTPKNDPTAQYIVIDDRQSDTFLTKSEPLPHQQINGQWQPVTNWPPPACGAFTSWNNRLWAVSSEDGAQIWYSKAVLPEPGGVRYAVPEMSPFNVYRLDDGTGPITGMQAMDFGLVVFKREHIFILNGQPNDDTGSGSTLEHQTIAVGTGCVDQRSIVLTPEGVFFQAEKGYYQLDRSQNLGYIGGDVEDLFRICGNVHSAVLIPNRHQIRIVMNETVTGVLYSDSETEGGMYVLIYDYLMKAWSRIDLVQAGEDAWRSTAVAGRSWRGLSGESLHVVLTQGGLLVEQDREIGESYQDESYSDADVLIPIDVKTGWIKDGLSRSTRIREIVIEADKPQESRVHVDVDYEVNGTWDSTLTDTFEWASPAPTTMRIRPRIQKLTAFRVRIYEPTGTGEVPITENIKIQSISYVVGHRGKLRKIADAKVGL